MNDNQNNNGTSNLGMGQATATAINHQVASQSAQEKAQQKKAESVSQGNITRDFHFEAQKERIDQILQRPRSQEYMAALDMIDYLSSNDEAIIERLKENMGEEFVEELEEMTDEEIFEMITKAFHDEFAELETDLDDEMIAVLSKCYIDGCDCHAIDQYGHILDHYRNSDRLSEDLERGRMVYRGCADKCQCVEVYKTCCRIISNTGDVEVIKK